MRYVVDIMTNFDHVRKGGEDNTYVFSIENGRDNTTHRSITIVLPESDGEYMGIKTSGRVRLSSIQKMPLLWEKSAEPSATDAVSANVTSELPNENGRATGSASNQSNGIDSKGSENSADGQMDGGETTGFRVRDGRHGSDGIGGPHGEHSGHEGAGGVRFWVREAVEPLTGEAGLLGLTCGCEHCIVAQMLFRGGGCRRWMEWREQHGARAALLRSLRHSLSVSHRVSVAGTVRNMLP